MLAKKQFFLFFSVDYLHAHCKYDQIKLISSKNNMSRSGCFKIWNRDCQKHLKT